MLTQPVLDALDNAEASQEPHAVALVECIHDNATTDAEVRVIATAFRDLATALLAALPRE